MEIMGQGSQAGKGGRPDDELVTQQAVPATLSIMQSMSDADIAVVDTNIPLSLSQLTS